MRDTPALREIDFALIGMQFAAGATQYSAYPPPATSAQSASPTFHCVTPAPTATTVPETSMPRMSGAPGGTG